ncbi:MAG: HEPN domain-containing protein [Nitrospiria bacterium]
MGKEDYEIWLERANGNLKLAKEGKVEGVFLEDLCFEAQQAAEKALKALLIYLSDEYPKVHAFSVLLDDLEKHIEIPDSIKEVLDLSDYAVQTRYPGDYYPVGENEYSRAITIAEEVINWVKERIEQRKREMDQGTQEPGV